MGVSGVLINEGEERRPIMGLSLRQRGRPMIVLPPPKGQKHQKWSKATQILMSSVVRNVVDHVCC